MTSSSYNSLRAQLALSNPGGTVSTAVENCIGDCIGTSISFTTSHLLNPDDELSAGDYTTLFEITPICPSTRSEREWLEYSIPVGISYVAMQLVLPPNLNAAGYLYEKVQPCDVFCSAPLTNRTPAPVAACVQLQIPYTYYCSPVVRVRKLAGSCICYDVNIN